MRVCLDLAKTWTIFNPLKKSSPNTLASRKARVCPSTNFFLSSYAKHLLRMDDMEVTCKTLLIAFDNLLPSSNVSWNFFKFFKRVFQSCFKLFFGWLWFWCLEDNYCLYEKNDVSWPKMDQFQLKTSKLNT